MSDLLHSPAVLALELDPTQRPARLVLGRDEAAELAGHIAADLARLLPGAADVSLVVGGALYDPAQALRPAWPLFAELAELARRGAPAEAPPQVLAFGAADGAMPTPALEPDATLVGGAMLLVPWMLSGPADRVQALGQRMELEFVARGEAGPHTADWLMRTLGVRMEHARYLTRHDLCAMMCIQLEHAGLSAFWQVLEAALFAPERVEQALSSRGRTWNWRGGVASTGVPAYAAWHAEYGAALPAAERAHAYAGWLFELRQYAAMLAAHRLPLTFHDNDGAYAWPLQARQAVDASLPPAVLFAHEARGLGIVALTAAQPRGDGWRVLAHAWPLDAGTLDGAVDELARRYAAEPGLRRLGRIALAADGSDLAAG